MQVPLAKIENEGEGPNHDCFFVNKSLLCFFAINKKITTFAIAKFKQSQWKIL